MSSPLQYQYRFPENTEITEKEIEKLAFDLMSVEWRIPTYREEKVFNLIKLGWTFKWSTRKRSIGTCDWRKKQISLSKEIFTANTNKSHEWEDTLRHELAHALDALIRGYSDHSKAWKNIARLLLSTPLSTSGKFDRVESKYLRVCPNCKKEAAVHKRTHTKVACGDCCKKYSSNRFNEKFVLELVVNQSFSKAKKTKQIIETEELNEKTCRLCKKDHSVSTFGKDKASKDGLSSVCKLCEKEYRKNRKRLKNS